MPGPIKASDAVLKTRRYCAILGSGAYRDGFSDDSNPLDSQVPILGFLNTALRILCETGIVQGDFYISAPSGTLSFTYPSGMGKLINMTVSGTTQRRRPLREITLLELNSRDRLWEYTGGTPNVYATLGPEFVVYPVPDKQLVLKLRGHTLATDLTGRNSVPSELPIWYHEAYPLLAAIILLYSDDSPNRQGRVDGLVWQFTNLYPSLKELVHERSLLAYRTRMEGDTQMRRMNDG